MERGFFLGGFFWILQKIPTDQLFSDIHQYQAFDLTETSAASREVI